MIFKTTNIFESQYRKKANRLYCFKSKLITPVVHWRTLGLLKRPSRKEILMNQNLKYCKFQVAMSLTNIIIAKTEESGEDWDNFDHRHNFGN